MIFLHYFVIFLHDFSSGMRRRRRCNDGRCLCQGQFAVGLDWQVLQLLFPTHTSHGDLPYMRMCNTVYT
jgi:hypothetical protein